MLLPDLSDFTNAVATAGNQPDAAFDALCALSMATIGVRLFTVMDYDAGNDLVRRLYSNMPEAYPVSGTKPAGEKTPWFHQVIEERKIFSTNTHDGIAGVFDDHALIRSLGCGSVINIPVVVAGSVLGTINCLHEEGFYTQDRIDRAHSLALPGAVCLMLAERHKKGA